MPSPTFFNDYAQHLQAVLANADYSGVAALAQDIHAGWLTGKRVFICGNGGSAANAIHICNDLVYGVAKQTGGGVKAQALSANTALLTCLGNDLGYEHIFAEQLAVQAQAGDLLLVLSGSGNSPNIVRVLTQAKTMAVKTYGIFGYSGGLCKSMVDVAIHFAVNDMQIAEDLQLVVGHMLMQWLYMHRPALEG